MGSKEVHHFHNCSGLCIKLHVFFLHFCFEQGLSTAARCEGNSYIPPSPSGGGGTGGGGGTPASSAGLPILLFFSCLSGALGYIASFFLRFATPTYNDGKLGKGGKKKMYVIYGFVILVMVYLTTVSVSNDFHFLVSACWVTFVCLCAFKIS